MMNYWSYYSTNLLIFVYEAYCYTGKSYAIMALLIAHHHRYRHGHLGPVFWRRDSAVLRKRPKEYSRYLQSSGVIYLSAPVSVCLTYPVDRHF